MRNAKINKVDFSAVRYKKTEEVKDSNNHLTGEKIITYYPVQHYKANISGAKGGVFVEIFGSDVSYDKTIVLTKREFLNLKFDDNTVFFIDKKPEFKNGSPLYDYRVSKIAHTINQVVIAIKKADK